MPIRYDATGVESMKGFDPFPPGEYDLVIKNTEEKTTEKGFPMVNVTCEVAAGEYEGRKLFHNVVFLPPKNDDGTPRKGAGISLHFLHAIGEPYEGEFETDPVLWIGRKFTAQVMIEEYNGVKRNKVRFVTIPINGDGNGVPF